MPTITNRSAAAAAADERLLAAVCELAAAEPGDVTAAVQRHVRRLAPLARPEHAAVLVRAALARLEGLGRLDALLADPAVDEVLVNPGGDVWTERAGELLHHGHIGEAELAVVIERILAPLGRRLDRSSPIVDARLADGTRVCAVVPPIAVGGTTLSLRRFRAEPFGLDAFCDDAIADVLIDLVEHRCNLVVSGATSSGKTSLLSSLLTLAGHDQRLVVLEDTAELAPPRANVVRLEARPATADGVVAVTLAQLVRTALRLRPDRIVVGEVRGDEAIARHLRTRSTADSWVAPCRVLDRHFGMAATTLNGVSSSR